jgi:hypothetical protein
MTALEAARVSAYIAQQWREAMLAKLIACGATEKQARWLLDCGIPWMLVES